MHRLYAPVFGLFLSLFFLWPLESYAYVTIKGLDHPQMQTMNLQLGCPAQRGRIEKWGPCWDDVAEHAIAEWNAVGSQFVFQTTRLPADPCNWNDGLNTIGWSDTLCGQGPDPIRLAYATVYPGSADRDIVLNASRRWGAYPGSWRYQPPDLHRVVLHELGHVIGLGHPNEHGQTVVAMMNSSFSDIDHLQDDDSVGALALHGAAAQRVATATLESPAAGAHVSGVGFISGWKCEVGTVTVRIDDGPLLAVATEQPRADTRQVCGDDNNGFITQINWNWGWLGAGPHTAVAYDDGAEFARSTFTIGTTGEEFLEDVSAECTVPDFPAPGETGRFVWNESTQHLELAEVSSQGTPPTDQVSRFDGTWVLTTHPERNCPLDGEQRGVMTIASGAVSGTIETSGGPFSNVATTHTLEGAIEASGVIRMSYILLPGIADIESGFFVGTLQGDNGSGEFELREDGGDPLCTGTWRMWR